MRRKSWLPVAMCLGLSTACWHQVVQTGRNPGNVVVEKQFVATWLWGLVPAQEVDVRQQCPIGVASVETEQSFMNGLVLGLTLGLYTPQHVKITCASSTASIQGKRLELTIPANASKTESAEILRRAIASAEELGAPVVLKF
jgi:hypothetical protein